MKLHDYIIIYERETTDDGAGGKEPGDLDEKYQCYANVKPLSGLIGMQFQALTGSQGYDIWIRTDFDRKVQRDYIVRYQGIYGDLDMVIQSVAAGKHFTKLTCKSENKL